MPYVKPKPFGEDPTGPMGLEPTYVTELRQQLADAQSERDAARAEVERLREALVFYADGITDAGDGIYIAPDDGTIARAALESEGQS